MKKILYDKVNKREANVSWFTDKDGDIWLDVEPYNVQIDGTIKISPMDDIDSRYEVRDTEERIGTPVSQVLYPTLSNSLKECPFHYCDNKPVCKLKCKYK